MITLAVISLLLPLNYASAMSNTDMLDDILIQNGLTDDYTMRNLYDLSGNLYWLIEFDTTGYAIYHPGANKLSEFSTSARSPFLNYTEIFYGGPTFYFVKIGDNLTNVLTNEHFELNAIQAQSQSINSLDEIYSKFISAENLSTRASDTTYLVPNAYYFQKLNSFGQNTQGTCGQLAASILLSYYANYYNVNFVPTQYISPKSGTSTNYQSWQSMPNLSDSLHQELIQITRDLNENLATTGSSIKRILSEYYYRHVLGGVSQSVLTSPFFTDTNMRNIINSNNPMIMFGKLTLPSGSKGNHAVVCYGYRIISNVTYYTVHMGYSGYTSVELANLWSANVFGQIYSITYSGTHVHSGNFIVNGTPHCGCGAVTI